MPFSVENPCGRLITIRLDKTITDSEVGGLRTKMWLTLSAVESRAVMVGDMTRTVGFAPGVEFKLLGMLKVDNPKVERSAFILDVTSASFGLQVERILAEAGRDAEKIGKLVPDRRTFRDKTRARAWLDEVLTPAERKQLAAFIDSIA